MRLRPPTVLALLARLVIRGEKREFVLGDLDELYARRVGHGRFRAGVRYVRDVFVSMWRLPGGGPHRRPAGPLRPPTRWTPGDAAWDLRLAVRSVRQRPGFTLLIVVTLALGTGPTLAVVAMVDQLLVRPLPGAANSASAAYLRLLDPESTMMEFNPSALTLEHFDELRARATLLDGVASYGLTSQHVILDGGRPVRVSANTIYGDFFEVLGVGAAEGRLLSAADTRLDANPLVAVISEDLRARLFGSGGPVVGQIIQMNGQPVEVIGVAGGGFRGAVRGSLQDAWLPHAALVPLLGFPVETLRSPRSTMHSRLLALPRPGVAPEAVEQQVGDILSRLGEAAPERAAEYARIMPTMTMGFHAPPTGRERAESMLTMMGWAAALLLVIACANVANLLLFQNLARRGALATMRAIGASGGRIARQDLTRSLLVAALGVGAGAGVGWGVARLFRGQLLSGMPEFEGLRLDHPGLLLWVGGAVLATTVLFGVAPAVLAGRFDLSVALATSRTRETGRLGPLRTALSAGQIALTLSLLVGGLLMVRTLMNFARVDTGIDVEGIVGATFDLPSGLEPAEQHALERRVLEAVSGEPGVQRAALDVYGPHGSRYLARVGLPSDAGDATLARVYGWQVSPGWFELFGLRPVGGRTFEDADWRIPSTGAAVLTASLAERLFGSAQAVGGSIWVQGATPPERHVVGVVRDYTSLLSVVAESIEEARRPSGPTDAVFLPYGDVRVFQVTVFAKTTPSAPDVPERVQEAIESVVADVPSPEPYLLSDRVERIHHEERLLGRLLLVLAGLGALMSSVGLFGAVYYTVSSRKQELGIRVALGADAARILRLVARSAAVIVGVGLAAGLLVAYPISMALQARLFGLEPLDVTSYALAAGALGLVALLACLAPAREALGTDPAAVLRQE